MSAKRALTPEQERAIVERYSTGESALAISRTLPVSVQTVHNTLHRLNVPVRPELAKKRLSEDQRRLVVEACLGGATVPAVARLFATSPETVLRILKANGIRLPKGRPRSCTVNDNAFDVLTPEASYWVGFLFADGCVHQDEYGSPVVAKGLSVKDSAHVEKFRSFLGSTHAISIRPPGRQTFGGDSADFRVRSKRLFAALVSHGMVKVKADRVPSAALENSRDFWRGVVDGDGGVYIARYPQFFICGQHRLLESCQAFLKRKRLASLNIVPTESGIFQIETTGSTAREIIRALYENASISLDRKQQRANEILANH